MLCRPGRPPAETVEGVARVVGDAGIAEGLPGGRGQFMGGEGDPGPHKEGEGVRGGRQLPEGPLPSHHRAVWRPDDGGHEEGNCLSPCL